LLALIDIRCTVNARAGTWSAELSTGSGSKKLLTGNSWNDPTRLTMVAVVSALACLKRRCAAEIHAESDYVTRVAARWCSIAPKEPKNQAAKRISSNGGAWLEFRSIAALHDIHFHHIKPNGLSEFVGRCRGFGSDVGYVFRGATAPWDDSLGTEYRAFFADEMELEQDCEQILDDDHQPISIDDDSEPYRPAAG
jgi:ribonuclease HI